MAKHIYQEPDKFIILNQGDPNLFPIKVDILDVIKRTYRLYNLPEPTKFPDPRKIKGYGNNPYDQIFEREIIPADLINLEKEIRNDPELDKLTNDRRENTVINNFWKRLEAESKRYADVIEWINLQVYQRLLGHWFFCEGKPVYITGTHWFFLNYWHLDGNLPEYRFVDRLEYLAIKFLQTDTTTFANINPQTRKPIPNENGEYEMVDLGRRVWYGINLPKSRRVGATSRSSCENVEYATRTSGAHCGVQGKDADNAAHVFENHIVTPFNRLPIFFKPLCVKFDPSERLIFKSDDPYLGLNTRIDYATSQERGSYDGFKLHRIFFDEIGKVQKANVSKRQETVKHTLALGTNIFGFATACSTIDEMEKEAGANYLKLTQMSYYDDRDENGSTISGLCTVFFSADVRMETFIGKYGESISDDPTPDQSLFINKKIGAKKFILNKRNAFVKAKQYEALTDYMRMFSLTFKEIFTPPSRNAYFRLDIINGQLDELTFGTKKVRRGNFHWSGNRDESKVIWIDDDEGRFTMSKSFSPEETNKRIMENGTYYPNDPYYKYVASADAYRLEATEGGKMSDGSICIRYKHDPIIDPPDKNISNWESACTVIDYLARPEMLEVYGEDALMACIYTNAMMYPESNQDFIQRYFISRNYRGYLLYDYDTDTGHFKKNAGFYTTIEVKKKMFVLISDDIQKHGKRNWHENILRATLEIKNMDDLTNWDAFVGYAGTLLAEQVSTDRLYVGSDTWTDDWLPTYSF